MLFMNRALGVWCYQRGLYMLFMNRALFACCYQRGLYMLFCVYAVHVHFVCMFNALRLYFFTAAKITKVARLI